MDRPINSIFSSQYINDTQAFYRQFVPETDILATTLAERALNETKSQNIKIYTAQEMDAIYARTAFNCPIEGEYSNSNLLWASILFDTSSANLNKNNSSIIGKTINLQRNCNRRILLMAHNSQYEVNAIKDSKGLVEASLIANNRAKVIFNELVRGGVPSAMIDVIVCGRTMPRYSEKLTHKMQHMATKG